SRVAPGAVKRPGLLLVLPLGGMLLLGAAAAAENHPQPKPASRHPASPAPAPSPHPSPAPAARPVAIRPAGHPIAGQPAVVVTGCWLDAHPFRGLAVGFVDYCRGHLGYAPGAPDCYTFADVVSSGGRRTSESSSADRLHVGQMEALEWRVSG